MSDFHALFRAFREGSTPTDARLAAVRAGLRRPPGRLGVPVAVGGIGGLLLAAAVTFALRTPPAPRSSTLPAAGSIALTQDVHVASDGDGDATVAGNQVSLAWRRGVVDVDVVPHRGIDLVVTTDEATVRVVGTRFEVVRDALGTTVTVTHGRVQADCAIGGPALVGAGESRTCLPRTAIGALGRVHALRDAGAAPATLLAEVEAAAARPDAGGIVLAELGVVRVDALLALDRPDEAVAAAERTLREAPGARDADLRHIAARLHVAAGDCAAGLPHLSALAAADALGEDAPLLARCSTEAP
jgi:ferric-dicitrate binding protein FerR (iron transport regulator)